jgi:hypothetical protein
MYLDVMIWRIVVTIGVNKMLIRAVLFDVEAFEFRQNRYVNFAMEAFFRRNF